MTKNLDFPKEFLWGVATSSYQIEGASESDGKAPSIWDTFTQIPGKIKNGDTGDIACDHYTRWREDIKLMKDLGVEAYRFSIAWSRILPNGNEGSINPKGLDFYENLVDALLEENITPFITLYHWDLPQALYELGGWPERFIVESFAKYADVVSARLGDRVKNWITHNEPWVVSTHGYLNGCHAPGHKNWKEALSTAHHLLLSHGMAVKAIRSNASDAKVGITLNLCPAIPASNSPEDLQATRIFDGEFNRWYLDPLLKGRYPEDIVNNHIKKDRVSESDFDFVKSGDLAVISEPIDFLGVNYYSRGIIRSDEIPENKNAKPVVFCGEKTDIGWEIHADSLYELLLRLKSEYPVKSIYITENGAAYNIGPDKDGIISDQKRIQYLKEHLTAAHRAINDGAILDGYFAWTLMDNFEWAEGYSQKFGLVWMEPETLNRIKKDSFHWYQKTIHENSILL